MSKGLRSILVLSLLLLSVVASSHGSNNDPRQQPAPERTTPPPVVVSVRDSGFHWADAGVGAAATLATLLAVGVALVLRPDRRSNTGRVAALSDRREGA